MKKLMLLGVVIGLVGIGIGAMKFLNLPEPTRSSINTNKFANENRPAHRNHPYGGTLVMGTINRPTIINPVLTTHSVSASLIPVIFNGLIRINSQGDVEPSLAESWDISEDDLVYTFHLRKGVLFHDGVEATAADVKFTYEKMIDPKVGSMYRCHFELVDHFEVVDKYTFRMILKEPFIPLLTKMVRYILPKHILEGEDLSSTDFNYHPIGTGPFKFKSWDRATDKIELEDNPVYFEGRPYLDNIIVNSYPDNKYLWAAFMRQEIDLVKFIPYEDYKVIEKDSTFKTYRIPTDMYLAMVYNPKDPVFFDREVRKAIAHAVDKKEMMRAMSSYGMESTGPFSSKSTGFNPDVKAFEYDPIKAHQILMHRGWRDMHRDAHGGEYSIRQKGGKPLELRLLVDARHEMYRKAADVIFLNLAKIGINTKLLFYDNEDELTPEYLEKYKPQAWLRFFLGFGRDPYEVIGSWYSASTQFGKLWQYQNKEVDMLFESGRITKDEKLRQEVYKKIHRIIYEDQPACFFFFVDTSYAVVSKFKNTDDFFTIPMPTYTRKDWYIQSDRSPLR